MAYRFGVFGFDAETGELSKNGRLVALEPQPARALARLLVAAGEVVSRDELKEAVWAGDTHVDFDRGLAYCLSQIRAALGDSGDNPRFVQTLPRKGYRFIAPVIDESGAAASDAITRGDSSVSTRQARNWIVAVIVLLLLSGAVWFQYGRLSPRARRIIVAVSIFDNESGRPEYDRVVGGLSDLVVTRLTEIAPGRIAVVGNAAVLRQPRNIRNLKAIEAGVQADYVVLGQLQTAGTGLRFISHLIRLSDQTHLKASRFLVADGDLAGMEVAVVAEFERTIRDLLE